MLGGRGGGEKGGESGSGPGAGGIARSRYRRKKGKGEDGSKDLPAWCFRTKGIGREKE